MSFERWLFAVTPCSILTLPFPVGPDAVLPTSFRYGGVSSQELLADWRFHASEPVRESGRKRFRYAWTAPDGFQARLEAVSFDGTTATEFRWVFTNTGDEPSERVTDAYAIDIHAPSQRGRCVLHTAMGGIRGELETPRKPVGFELEAMPLGEKTLTVSGGRSSNGHLPFFCLEHFDGNQGVAGALGWSGQWKAWSGYGADRETVVFRAGMAPVGFRLPPGESVRMPRALLLPYEGNARQGKNGLRRILRDHYQGRLAGKRVPPPVSFSTWFVFHNDVHAEMLTELAEEAARLGIEYVCLDAGWFEGGFPDGVGNWTIDRKKFLKRAVSAYKEVRGWINRDYYPVFSQTRDPGAWNGWQFADPDTGKGMVIAYRPGQSKKSGASIGLRG